MPRHGTNERDYMSYTLEVSVGSKVASSAPPREEIKQKSVENGLIEYVDALEGKGYFEALSNSKATNFQLSRKNKVL